MKIRAKTRDATFTYRMGAGFAGDVNRIHPASIEPVLLDQTAGATPNAYGIPVLYSANNLGVRMINATTDAAITKIDGILVRPYPFQQATAQAVYGSVPFSTGATSGFGGVIPFVGDILKSGYVMVFVVGTPAKGAPIFLWVAAPSGNHVTGGFEAVASGANTIQLVSNSYFNGPPDANGITEIAYNV